MSERVLVAMSGGVDSSVTAALLVEQGYEVVGLTMHLAGDASRCCSLDDADDARRVAEALGARFFVANYTEAFQREVIDAFADAYLAGRTPIPCVACNKRFKFDLLMDRAEVLGARQVATGHYARIRHDVGSGLYELRCAADPAKDQTYFLFQLDQSQLARIAFPLGGLNKEEVRERARRLGLPTADKPESQEICFVPDGNYAKVVEKLRPEARAAGGEIVDAQGRVLGRHAGIHRFTVGQRHGLGLAVGRRLYVRRIEAESGRVVVDEAPGLEDSGAVVANASWIAGPAPTRPIRARVKVRHRHQGVPATLEPVPGGGVRVRFDRPVTAVTPGQAAVFYEAVDSPEARRALESGEIARFAASGEGARVLGGGWIAEALRAADGSP